MSTQDQTDEIRYLLARALEGAAQALRAPEEDRQDPESAQNQESPAQPIGAEDVGLDLDGRLTLTVPELASRLGIGRSSAYEAIRSGEIPSVRIGRRIMIPVPALLAWLSERSTADE